MTISASPEIPKTQAPSLLGEGIIRTPLAKER